MIHLIPLFALVAATLACAPGTGDDLGVMTIYFRRDYSELERRYLERYVRNALVAIARQYGKQYDDSYARINGRSVNGKVVVDVQSMNINCGYVNEFMKNLRRYIGNRYVDIRCPAN
ncbi:hypothetical protein Aduo_011048 [Ancylostoma duodenale]